MVLNEKHNEQNQQRWLSHAKRERINLSASVEEALEDSVGEEQNTNILKRFAQRLTSSFAAIGGNSQPEVIESSRQFPVEEGALPESMPISKEVDESVQQAYTPVVASLAQERAAPQRPLSLDKSDDEPRDRQSKLAGRTTRIHLETPPGTANSRQSGGARTEASFSDTLQRNSSTGTSEPTPRLENDMVGPSNASLTVVANLTERANPTNPSLPVTTRKMPVGLDTTGTRLSAVDASRGKGGAAPRRELSGSGVFEAGQGDATVVNRYVTETSVVLITLTANPGPVVTQYVTLRPRIGFTIHLTAPTTMRASFNYIVLLGELF